MLDKLRVCIICNYYSQNGRLNPSEYMNHPEICNLKCEHLDTVISDALSHSKSKNVSSNLERQNLTSNMMTSNYLKLLNENDLEQKDLSENESIEKFILKEDLSQSDYLSQLSKQFNVKICVGNVSKYLNNANSKQQESPSCGAGSLLSQKLNQTLMMNEDEVTKASIESSQYNQDLITHKWMIYIRSPNCHKLENYIKKVVFFLHFSYKPYDMVEIKYVFFKEN